MKNTLIRYNDHILMSYKNKLIMNAINLILFKILK